MTLVIHRSRVGVPRDRLYAFHQDVSNLARISPPFPRVTVEQSPGPTAEGDLQRITMAVGPFRQAWDARVTRIVPGRLVEDVQERGPFRRWRHQHRFAAIGETESELTDLIAFRLIPTPVGALVEALLVVPALKGMLVWRHRATRRLLEREPADRSR